jgi:MoxR-like ATPase
MVVEAELSETALLSQQKFIRLKEAMRSIIVGQEALIDRMLITLLAEGHLLIEGLPGLAKTLSVKTLAKAISASCKRIQFTPDLLPADLLGTSIYHPEDGSFSIKKGPIFTDILLADEINRAPPKVQSALLEVMGEKQVTLSSECFEFGDLFMVLATQNPVEHEGTYPLPEAQVDRFFMKVVINYPTKEEEKLILERFGSGTLPEEVTPVFSTKDLTEGRKIVHQIFVDPVVVDYIIALIEATRYPKKMGVPIENLLDFGASPRGTIALLHASKAHAFLDGRAYVTPHDVKLIAHDVLRHRMRASYEAEAEDLSVDKIIDRVLHTIPVP